jgi:uncharacterized protein YbgA (DUF1722 family)/uncharacterized protein YbbK (DUF523 family)
MTTVPAMKARAGTEDADVRIGISACLLGERVRFDGGHKRDSFLIGTFGKFVRYIPLCPEVEIGLGVPRETIRLEGKPKDVRLVATKSGRDLTGTMREYAVRKVEELARLDLSGFVLKKDSPSCGMERVRVYDRNGVPSKAGRGLFAEVLMARFPLLPVEEEGRLEDPRLRENFIERVFAYRRVRKLLGGPWKMGDLVRFHTAEKLLLLAHEPAAYTKLGRLVATAKGRDRAGVAAEYEETFLSALKTIATARRHTNVLQHMAGYFKKVLPPEQKAELAGVIEDFLKGLVPLVVPLTLIRHHVRVHGVSYLAGQTYLEPHPKELMLRNHV